MFSIKRDMNAISEGKPEYAQNNNFCENFFRDFMLLLLFKINIDSSFGSFVCKISHYSDLILFYISTFYRLTVYLYNKTILQVP